MRDRASVNNVAIRSIGMLYPGMTDIGCFTRTLDHVRGSIVAAEDLESLSCRGFSCFPIAQSPDWSFTPKAEHLCGPTAELAGGPGGKLWKDSMTCLEMWCHF